VLADNAKAVIDLSSYKRPAIFNWLQEQGGVDAREMYRTFNCGVGMVICVPVEQQEQALQELRKQGEAPFVLGRIDTRSADEEQVQLLGLSAHG